MVAIDFLGKNWSCRSPKGEEHMNEVLDFLILIGVLFIASAWIICVFIMVLRICGVIED